MKKIVNMMSFGRLSNQTQTGLVDDLVSQGVIKSPEVIQAMRSTDRGNYCIVSPYVDAPQGTIEGQTISAPHMHGHALELLAPNILKGTSALDVGCGSGYLTVAMAHMNPELKVTGTEIFPTLTELSRVNTMREDSELMLSGRVEYATRDGWKGYRERAPYDAIHVGAAARSLPKALLAQLKVGGRMIIPVGPAGFGQELVQVDRVAGDGANALTSGVNIDNQDPPMSNFQVTPLIGVAFVPLIQADARGY